MKIATWSVNSVNQRLRYLRHWLHRRQPDIVALQKIRVSRQRRENFPRKNIEEVGYHVEELLADRQLASVAVLVRQGFLNDGPEPIVLQRGLTGREADGRLLTVDAAGVRVASVYVPYAPCGGSTKDQVRRSIQAKAYWLRALRKCVADQPGRPKPTFLCGDFNVVLDGESKPDTLNRSPEEREALTSLCASGFIDLYRDFHRDGRPGFNSGTPITSPPGYTPSSDSRSSERRTIRQVGPRGPRVQGADRRSAREVGARRPRHHRRSMTIRFDANPMPTGPVAGAVTPTTPSRLFRRGNVRWWLARSAAASHSRCPLRLQTSACLHGCVVRARAEGSGPIRTATQPPGPGDRHTQLRHTFA